MVNYHPFFQTRTKWASFWNLNSRGCWFLWTNFLQTTWRQGEMTEARKYPLADEKKKGVSAEGMVSYSQAVWWEVTQVVEPFVSREVILASFKISVLEEQVLGLWSWWYWKKIGWCNGTQWCVLNPRWYGNGSQTRYLNAFLWMINCLE